MPQVNRKDGLLWTLVGPEGIIKNEICEYLAILRRQGVLDFWLNHTTGGWDPKRRLFRKRNSKYDRNGVADIVGILRGGRALFVEVKSRTGVLSDAQKDFRDAAVHWGAIYVLARSVADVKNLLAEYAGLQ